MAKAKKQTQTAEERLAEALVPESEQPYDVPENWVWGILGATAGIRRGASPRPIKDFVTEDLEGVNWIKIGDTSDSKYVFSTKEKITKQGAERSVYVESGTLLLSNSMSFGRPYILSIDGCIHDGWLAITVSKCFDKDYMYYALLASNWYFEQVAVGTAVRNLNSERVAGLPCPIPPLPEQHRIVARIESLFEKLDRAKELVQSALDSFETRKAAILHRAFTGELTAKWREEHGVGIESWKELPLENIGTVKGGKRLPKGKTLVDENTGFPYIKAGDLKLGTVLLNKLQYLTPDVQKVIKNYTVHAGDIYITIVGACIGDVGVIPEMLDGANLTENAAKITELKCNSQYLGLCMSAKAVQSQIKDKVASATLGKLSLTNIKSLLIPHPTLPEQQEIVRILDGLLEKEKKAQELSRRIEKIDHMKKAILARAFRGELGTNDASEESALGLLDVLAY